MWHNLNIQFKYHVAIFYFTLVKISLLLLTRLKQFDNASSQHIQDDEKLFVATWCLRIC
jgi:hypothetical protein